MVTTLRAPITVVVRVFAIGVARVEVDPIEHGARLTERHRAVGPRVRVRHLSVLGTADVRHERQVQQRHHLDHQAPGDGHP